MKKEELSGTAILILAYGGPFLWYFYKFMNADFGVISSIIMSALVSPILGTVILIILAVMF